MNHDGLTTIIALIAFVLIVILLYKMLKSEDGGKLVVTKMHRQKIVISEIFLVAFAFFEGLTAAESSPEVGFYGIRLGIHVFVALAGAHVSMISIREFMDALAKTMQGGHTLIYLIIQWLKSIAAFFIGNIIPVANLWVIASGTGEWGLLFRGRYVVDGTEYYLGLIERLEYTSQIVTASVVIVTLHILLTFLIALWAVDDVVDKKKKPSEKTKEAEKEAKKDTNIHKDISFNAVVAYVRENKLFPSEMDEFSFKDIRNTLRFKTSKDESAGNRLKAIEEHFAAAIKFAEQKNIDGVKNANNAIENLVTAQYEFSQK